MSDYEISLESAPNGYTVGRIALPAGHPWRTAVPPHVDDVDAEGRVTFAWRFKAGWGPSSEAQARDVLAAAVADARAAAGRTPRAEVAEDAYFASDAPPAVVWTHVASMIRQPTGWTRTGLEEMAGLMRQWRGYELGRLAYQRRVQDEVRAAVSKRALDSYRDAERSLRGILARLGLVRRALPWLSEEQHAAIAAALPAGGDVTGEAWRRCLIRGLNAGEQTEALHALVCLVEGP